MKRLPLLALPLALLAACASLDGGAERTVLNGPDRDASLPFSDGVLVGDTLYVAGTLGLDPATGQAPADVEQEVRTMLDGFRDKLELAGMTMDDLVMVQVFCSNVDHYGTFNAIYRTYFDGPFPSRAFVGSGALLRGARFEINGIAVRGD